MSEIKSLASAIERAIEDSVRILVRHGATDDEIAEHIAHERKKFAEWQAEVLTEVARLQAAGGAGRG